MTQKTLIELELALEEVQRMQKQLADKAENLANEIMVKKYKEQTNGGSNSNRRHGGARQ